MPLESKIEYLIVDTSAFIKNAPLQEIGHKIITEGSVINEITSKRQIKRLVILPYDLKVEDAYPEDIKFVTEFSKKTGDYRSLSSTDIKIIALTYRFEKEKVGINHLKKEPEKMKEIIDDRALSSNDHPKNIIGFYMSEEKKEDNVVISDISNESEKYCKKINCNIEVESKSQSLSKCSNSSISDEQQLVTESTINSKSDIEFDFKIATTDEETIQFNKLNKKFEKLQYDPTDLAIDCGDITIDNILKPININTKIKKLDSEDQEEIFMENDDEGWITPKNIINIKKRMDSDIIKEKPATVACLTMDYAMQNVLMQIGLNIASLEGKVIKEMRTFILRCYSCFKTTGIVTKIFCPHCGNKTLKKVKILLDDEGKQQIYINFHKPLTSRGKKYSLPTFQGGKHACNPILFEDQPMPDQRPTKLGCSKNDPLNDDYIAGYSPFIKRDVNSRAAMLGIKSGVKYWMRRNPNEIKKYRK